MRKIMFALAAGAACAVFSATVTLTSSSSGDITISQALDAAGATLANLTGNDYDDVVVEGDGRILFDTDISAYTGAIHVSSGAKAVVTALGGLGATSGNVYVADGGALIADATGFAQNTFTLVKGEVHIAGVGPDGAGALVAIADKSQRTERTGMWGAGKIVMDADALITHKVPNGNSVVDFPTQTLPNNPPANLDMNGHTLTFAPRGGYIPVRFIVEDPGDIVLTNNMISVNEVNRLNGSSANRFIVKDGGAISLFTQKSANALPWTLVFDTEKPLRVERNGINRWDGPVQLNRDMKVEAYTFSSDGVYQNPEMHFYGPISGSGRIILYSFSPSKHSGHLWLYSPDSTFTGGIVMQDNTQLHVMTDGAVPSAGGPIIITNGVLDLQANCTLPSVDFFCSGDKEISGIGSVHFTGTFTKRGSGRLECVNSSSMDNIDLKAGTLSLATDTNTMYNVGVYEGDRSLGWSDKTLQTPEWGSPLWYNTTQLRDRTQTSLRWVMSANSFGKGGCTVYEGWIYCSASEAGKWRFASNVNSLGRLRIDNAEVINRQNQNAVGFGTWNMTEGWHHFMFRMGRVNSAGGPNTSVTSANEYNGSTVISMDADMLAAWQASGLGLGICKDSAKAEANTTNLADFVAFPSDPGDGSVLRLAKPGSADELALATAFTNRHTVASLTAATNTVLDVHGIPLFTGCVTGFPTVVNTSVPAWAAGTTPNITVKENWTAPADGLAAGAAFTVTGGALTFADGATLTVPDSDLIGDTHGGSIAVATASEGIVGMPTLVFADGDKRGRLSMSNDGKSLLLAITSGMTVIFR